MSKTLSIEDYAAVIERHLGAGALDGLSLEDPTQILEQLTSIAKPELLAKLPQADKVDLALALKGVVVHALNDVPEEHLADLKETLPESVHRLFAEHGRPDALDGADIQALLNSESAEILQSRCPIPDLPPEAIEKSRQAVASLTNSKIRNSLSNVSEQLEIQFNGLKTFATELG